MWSQRVSSPVEELSKLQEAAVEHAVLAERAKLNAAHQLILEQVDDEHQALILEYNEKVSCLLEEQLRTRDQLAAEAETHHETVKRLSEKVKTVTAELEKRHQENLTFELEKCRVTHERQVQELMNRYKFEKEDTMKVEEDLKLANDKLNVQLGDLRRSQEKIVHEMVRDKAETLIGECEQDISEASLAHLIMLLSQKVTLSHCAVVPISSSYLYKNGRPAAIENMAEALLKDLHSLRCRWKDEDSRPLEALLSLSDLKISGLETHVSELEANIIKKEGRNDVTADFSADDNSAVESVPLADSATAAEGATAAEAAPAVESGIQIENASSSTGAAPADLPSSCEMTSSFMTLPLRLRATAMPSSSPAKVSYGLMCPAPALLS